MTRVEYKRAAAVSPGKHGPLDWRVTFNGVAPKHSEVIFMLGMLLVAEDRYPRYGRDILRQFIDLASFAKSAERVLEVAEDCEESKEGLVSA